MPRLGRRRLDLPLARARLARLPRLGAPREPQAPRRGLRRGRPLLRRGARGGGGGARRPRSLRGGSARAAALGRRRDRLRATGHTASDQVETILYRLVSRGAATGMAPRSDDGVVHPLLPLWREETEAYCRAAGLDFRVDASNADTKRGLIRDEILPLLAPPSSGGRREPPARPRHPRHAAAGARRAARRARRLEARRPRRRAPGGARA